MLKSCRDIPVPSLAMAVQPGPEPETSKTSASKPGRALLSKKEVESKAVGALLEFMNIRNFEEVETVLTQDLVPNKPDFGALIAAWLTAAFEKKEVNREQFKVEYFI